MQLNQVDQAFHETYKQLLAEGHLKESRTGVDILMLPAMTMKFDLSDGALPWASTRGLRHRQSSEEMEWFISGSSFIKFLRDRNNGIWDDWFIKGTDEYKEPGERPCTFNERVEFAKVAGMGEDLENFADFEMVRKKEPLPADFAVTDVVFLEGNDPWDFYEEEITQLQEWLTSKGVPTTKPNGVEPVSLKKRLTRVSNQQSEIWTKICWAIDDHAPDGSPELDMVVQIWRKDKFVKHVPTARQAHDITKILDEHKVPAYPLADADIGPGGYGPQWRHWQDTQIIGHDLLSAYKAQGYTLRGTLGPVGHSGSDEYVVYREVDQLANVIEALKTNPDDRRMLVTAWNPAVVWRAALPPCHLYFQFMTTCRPGQDVFDDLIGKDKWKAFAGNCYEDQGIALDEETFVNRFNNDLGFRSYAECHLKWDFYGIPTRDLHCLLVMRSSDTPLGTPFNVAQYSLLTHVIANVCGMQAKSLTWVGGDAHIYVNQVEGIQEQLSRNSHPESDPRITFKRKLKSIDEFTLADVEFAGYEHRGFIDIPVAV